MIIGRGRARAYGRKENEFGMRDDGKKRRRFGVEGTEAPDAARHFILI